MIETIYQAYLACNGVCTDSRACQAGNLFVCLKGENFDGNEFAEKAVEMGCKYVLTSRKELLTSDESTNRLKLRLSESRSNVYIDYAEREQLHEGEARVIGESTLRQAQGQNIDSPNHQITESPYIYVEDTLVALQQLAAHHRKVLGTPIVGITGTNGKTTTKELVAAVLAKKYNVLYTLGNFNNHIGVPLTLLRLTKEHNMAVIEIGANHPGEIAFLANIVMPDAGLITNVGKAHLAGFGSFEGVKNTKAELYHNLLSRGKTVFVDADNAHLKEMLANIENDESYNSGTSTSSVTELYGTNPALPVNGKVVSCTPFVNIDLNIDGNNYHVNSQLIGSYNVSNMLSAACVGHYFGVPAAQIVKALSDYTPQNNRSQLTKTERNTLIVDAYNANPTSMEAALRNFALIQTDSKAVILGDMFELGDDSATEHQKVVSLLEQLGIGEAYLLGKNFETTTGIGTRFASTSLFKEWLQAHPLSGKTLLIKGSNSMKLTTLIDAL
ncbi:MAG: UDP-N-acetylmuramoyl-tripeptide--D-alanyl-D-alanine ligase [Paludibacteraceae bacterium]|nr:UDP-N-acetylmuramoyl-tripeptide--D-alanyl-D-alanine ligase [Paludibacteraceae bacterium]